MITKIKKFFQETCGVSSIEAAIVFPIMVTMMIGTFDLGMALMSNQKATRAAQMTADLLTRKAQMQSGDIDESIKAAELALDPLPADKLGVDIVSISFDELDKPYVVWRETYNMTPEDPDVVEDAFGLGTEGEGVLAVVVTYEHTPMFSAFITGTITIREASYFRGRKNAVVENENYL